MKYFQLSFILEYKTWIGQKVMVSGWGVLDEKKPPSKPDILQYATFVIWDTDECFLRWFHAEPETNRPSNWGEQVKKGTIDFHILHYIH